MARFRVPYWRRSLALACLALAAGIAIWVAHLDSVVTREFRGRHWSVPARVFAAPLELYVGAPVSANDLEQELRRLHYRPGDPSTGTGIYRRRNDSFDLRARRVRFIEELREPTSVSIRAGSGSITDLRQADGTELPVFRLDPTGRPAVRLPWMRRATAPDCKRQLTGPGEQAQPLSGEGSAQ